MKRKLLLFLLAFIPLITAQLSNYNCPATCVLPNCRCASLQPPVANPPQFLLLTFDDSLQADLITTAKALMNRRNPNGCSVRATWFAQVWYTDPTLAQQWYAQGHEIADHSVTHVSPFAGSYAELEGMRAFYSTYAGIPRGKISGVRFPFRNYTLDSINLLSRMNFTYDSSMSNSDHVWPYTMDYGVVSDCINQPNLCGSVGGLNAKGLWEIPMSQSGTTVPHLMDPFNDPTVTAPEKTEDVVSDMLSAFNARYAGNRAPFGVYLHPVWYGKAQPSIPEGSGKLAGVNAFLDAAMKNPDVWMVTGQQLIEYMKKPVPASQLASQPYMDCPTPPPGVCNGLTPSLAVTCNLPNGTISSCFGCPSSYPTLENPAPLRTDTTRCLVPDNCDGIHWDPIGCKCLCTTETCKWKDDSRKVDLDPNSLNGNGTKSNGTAGSGKSSAGEGRGRGVGGVLVGVVLSLVFLVL
ncbi:hypothetical protein HK098_003096 [Nowakowskiella sp. JEL0407]|nr:hypothetical protein HK098_003096 [Nowakowskiella sp. JEL0407]